jgi:hypothetical protein
MKSSMTPYLRKHIEENTRIHPGDPCDLPATDRDSIVTFSKEQLLTIKNQIIKR